MNAPRPPSFDVHVVAHLQCERHWYGAADRCPRALVTAIDAMLDASPANTALLGGDVSVLEDYLIRRPGRRALLAERLRSGQVEAGPWYVLPDELIPSGEALIRNLSAGRRTVRTLGGAPPSALYSPVAFGHPAALPILTRGFGFLVAIVWRGFGGARWPAGDLSRMRAPDGTEALLFHLPRAGTALGLPLPLDEAAWRAWWQHLRGDMGMRSKFGVLLVLHTITGEHGLRELPALMETLAASAVPDRVRRSTLSAFAKDLHYHGRRKHPPLAVGELRDSYGYALTLQGTFATRAYQKRDNARLERLLLRDVEPWVTLAAIAEPAHAEARRARLDRTWRTLLVSHAHKTLCGCCSDAIARAMDQRLDNVRSQAVSLRRAALAAILEREGNPTTPHDGFPSAVLLRNPSPRPRGGLVELLVHAIGPSHVGDAHAPDTVSDMDAPPAIDWSRLLLDDGRVPMQLLASGERDARSETLTHAPSSRRVTSARLLAWVGPLPGFGTTALTMALREGRTAHVDALEERAVEPVRLTSEGATPSRWILDNGLLRFEMDSLGNMTLTPLSAGSPGIQRLIAFESVADRGDLYTHSPIGEVREAQFASVRVAHSGPLRCELVAHWILSVPARLRRPRPGQTIAPISDKRLRLRVRIALDARSHVLQLRITGRNRARDHRLRVVVATGVSEPTVVADAAFGPIARRAPEVPAEDRKAETPPLTAPLHRFVTLTNATAGATVLSDGLAEYEAKADGGVAVTLVRAVARLSRRDLPERLGHVDRGTRTPEAQSPGRFEARLAIFPHQSRGRALGPLVEQVAEDLLSPIRGVTSKFQHTITHARLGAELTGEALAFSSLTSSDDGAWTLARCVNITEDECRGVWRFDRDLQEAHDARLDGTLLDAIPVVGATVAFIAGPRAVVTIAVR